MELSVKDKKQNIKALFKKFIVEPNEHNITRFILVQHLSRGVIHQFWNSIYAFHPKYHQNPSDAVRDAMYPKLIRKQQIFRELMENNKKYTHFKFVITAN